MSMQKVIDDALFMMVMKDFKLLPIVEDRFWSLIYAFGPSLHTANI
jgi:hypothetical protein